MNPLWRVIRDRRLWAALALAVIALVVAAPLGGGGEGKGGPPHHQHKISLS